MHKFELIYAIVNCGQGTKALRSAKQHGARGGTICMGVGTVKSKLLAFLDLDEVKKEVVMVISDREFSQEIMQSLAKELAVHKPNHGIVFSMPVTNFIGTKHCEYEEEENRMVNETVYNAIYVVVDRGKAEEAVDLAKKGGARGGTIINARGSGIHDTGILFAMQIEPEKEIVLILCQNEITGNVVNSVRNGLEIDKPGTGIIFVMAVKDVYGLYQS